MRWTSWPESQAEERGGAAGARTEVEPSLPRPCAWGSPLEELRRSGQLPERPKRVHCSVLAIHGDHGPYPAAGVEAPAIRDIRFVLLERCGHTRLPWTERWARERFFELLVTRLGD